MLVPTRLGPDKAKTTNDHSKIVTVLNTKEAVNLLDVTLTEEKKADALLTKMAETVVNGRAQAA